MSAHTGAKRRGRGAAGLVTVVAVGLAGRCNGNGGHEATVPPSPAAIPRGEVQEFAPYTGMAALTLDTSSSGAAGNGATALDGLDHAAIAKFRRSKVEEHAYLGLYPTSYDPFVGPARGIWQQITPGAAWLPPAAYYVANPYHLVVLTCANHVTPLALFCPDAELRYAGGAFTEVYTGSGARCWLDRVFDPDYADHAGTIRVVMVNAYDASFRFAHVDLAASANVEAGVGAGNVGRDVYSQPSFFHVGRYGKNNLSPEDRNGWLVVRDREAATRVVVKLWRERPATPAQAAPLRYTVSIEPEG